METLFKPGDVVRIKSLDWYNTNKNLAGNVKCETDTFVSSMAHYCGQEVVIERHLGNNKYYIEGDIEYWCWTPEMFEEEF